MNGVTFGNYHSWDDFSLILNSKTIDAPTPKIETIDLPGADGVLDVSEYFGEIKYNNRKLTFEFSTVVPQNEFLELFSEIQNALHGQKLRITLDDDQLFYYVGRITLDSWKADKSIGKITIECDCEPYKYKLYPTIINHTISSSETLVFPNLKKQVAPKITTSAAITIVFNGTSYSISAGVYNDPAITFLAGNNTLTITGSTNLTVEYQEGGL